MLLRFRHLGVIKRADIDISKPLIVFTGPNGTGKTYLSYVLSDLPSSIGGHFMGMARKGELGDVKGFFDPSLFQVDSVLEGTLDPDVLYDLFLHSIKAISKTILPRLNIKTDNEKSFRMDIMTSREDWKRELYDMELDCGFFMHIEKKSGTYKFKATDLKEAREKIDSSRDDFFEMALFLNSLLFSGSAAATMLTAERSGIALFSKEIAIGRLKSDSPSLPRYPRPISLGLAESEDRTHQKRYKSMFDDLASDIEASIIKGGIEVTPEGDLVLNKDDHQYDLALTSSSIKALADLVYYIRYRAQKMSRLIIDEPEINLHPNNQLLLARVFAKMLNRGLKLVISTHSDYIIRELNNLIMLGSIKETNSEKLISWGYSQQMAISHNDVGAYVFCYEKSGQVVAKPVVVSDSGFKAITIDETIRFQNEVSQALYYELRYGKGQ